MEEDEELKRMRSIYMYYIKDFSIVLNEKKQVVEEELHSTILNYIIINACCGRNCLSLILETMRSCYLNTLQQADSNCKSWVTFQKIR